MDIDLKNLLSLFKPYLKKQLKAVNLLVIEAFCMACLPILTVKIIDYGIGEKNISVLVQLTIIFIVLVLVYNILLYYSNLIYNKISGEMAFELRKRILNHIRNMDGEFYTQIKSGEILSIIVNDVGNIQQLCSQTIFTTVTSFLTAVPIAIYMFTLSPLMFLLILIIQPVFIIIQNKVANRIQKESIKVRDSYSAYNSSLQEYLFSPMNAEKVGAGKFILNKALEKIRQNIDSSVKSYVGLTMGQINASLKGNILIFSIFIVGGLQIIIGNTTLGIITVYIQYAGSILAPFSQLEQLIMQYKQTKVSIRRVFSLLEQKSILKNEVPLLKDGIVSGEIEIENLCFSYNEKKIFEKLTCQFKNNMITAIVGKSGVGKTTLTNILFRFWEYNAGTVKIDGVDIRKFDINYLRNNISIVTQDILLINDTIYNNLVYDNINITSEEVVEACKVADIYNFIMSLESKFNTIVGDRGIKLSGGQKQRLSIAAAILRNKPIIIFDEATSALDNLTQTHILTQLKNIFRNKTVIVIAHRLSTIADADYILVIDKGKVVEKGTHHYLLKKNGVYTELYQSALKE